MVDITGTAAATSGQTLSTVASNKLSADYQSFLKLLTAQLTNQDPLEPMDSSTFVSQLAQLSQVEQSIQTNTHLESISGQLANAGLTSDLGLIGREVSVPGDLFDLIGGKGTFEYVLATTANEVRAIIRDSAGNSVAQIEGLKTGAETLHSVDWNGIGSEGTPVADGIYTAEIIATGPEGNVLGASAFTRATVERLTLSGGESVLHLSNGNTALSSLVAAVE
ncbi:related to basal-body rod modification protein (FlgD) [Pseudooceanicola batsensis HTCC2597]|uniref:Basal-body rod modification protein FlgD n=1 Tax=Pseudooceanicola batsensis (strain ATCC BAA-863 / DSM 15984 / KCTC 12145 / HTCC2597) TaxID=252305 RepID=A3U109_PSEBH|nr:flagellar hook assembly protein FlgD [Pseudooceanicola batsensis]EAQ01992.1 related to basal-body rod modification protein (FlgD) [Pseudooceanicola batsensis HTCC2597]